MNANDRFAPLDPDSLPAASRPLVEASRKKMGFVPSPIARAARAPQLLKHLLAGFPAFEQSSLSPVEREIVAMTVAYENECHYCMAMHSALLAASDGALVAALRDGRPLADARLEALRRFARAVLNERGRVPAEASRALAEAGYTEAQALDVVLGVGVYFLSTIANVITGAEIDPPFAGFAWERPRAA
jgi:uncharacterized peroxidase-related enzyme